MNYRTGQVVVYAGDLVEAHGTYLVVGVCDCTDCVDGPDPRWVLINSKYRLSCVHPEAFTPATADEPRPVVRGNDDHVGIYW